MPSRELEFQKEWRVNVLTSLDDQDARVHKLELEFAVFKAKWGIVMALIGFVSSAVGSAVIHILIK